jgi:lysophospholipase L1-like esterase
MNTRSTRSRVKYILIFSIALNAIGVLYVSKKLYYNYQRQTVAPPPPPENVSYFLNRQKVYKLFPVSKDNIVFAGDSHTQFFDTQEYLPGYKIINRGIGGDFSKGLLNRLNDIIGGHPKKLFVEIGFNDIWLNFKPSVTISNIKSIINKTKLQSPNTKIYIVSIFPSSVVLNGINTKDNIPKLNSELKRLCDNDIIYIDMYPKLSDKGSLNKRYDSGDGIHLNADGYSLYANVLKSYL